MIFMRINRELLTRGLIAALILMSGLALIPYLELPQKTLGWEQFAGIYTPELVVEPEFGRPGSTFTGTGSNYPANTLATVYVDGDPLGTVMTDENGSAIFYINTIGADVGVYNVTLEVDINTSATDTFELIADGPLILAPPNPAGPVFYLINVMYLPIFVKD
jgi:hypothetical protein